MTTVPAGRKAEMPIIIGSALTVMLVILAFVLPSLLHWQVNAETVAPLHASWQPRVGPGTIPAVAFAIAAVVFAQRLSRTVRWRTLLIGSFLVGLGWMFSLAFVDGQAGVSNILTHPHEYLASARGVRDVFETLREFVARIPVHAPGNWPIQVSAHPPGALLFFVALVWLHLGSGYAAGIVVTVLAATLPLAVLLALRRLGSGDLARAAAPFLVFAPAAIWLCVSGDAVFASVAAWGLCALAFAATSKGKGWARGASWSTLAGLLLGASVFLSYGLVLLAVAAAAILVLARSWRPVPVVLAVVAAMTVAFAIAGFEWWRGYAVLTHRYFEGIASVRPYGYWVWADLAALAISAGPVIGPAVALAIVRARLWRVLPVNVRTVVLLTLAGCAMVLLADVSGMSKAEVERIWLPFIPWLLVGTALLPPRWVRLALTVQVTVALLVEHLLHVNW